MNDSTDAKDSSCVDNASSTSKLNVDECASDTGGLVIGYSCRCLPTVVLSEEHR